MKRAQPYSKGFTRVHGRTLYTPQEGNGPAIRNPDPKKSADVPYYSTANLFRAQAKQNKERVARGEATLPVTRVLGRKRVKPPKLLVGRHRDLYEVTIKQTLIDEVRRFSKSPKCTNPRAAVIRRLNKLARYSRMANPEGSKLPASQLGMVNST